MSGELPPLRFGKDGLVPAVIVEAATGSVLMVGFMNDQALAATRETGFVHFWSRSRNRLWKKGETSGHVQRVEQVSVNCDLNSLLIEVTQAGAVCHDGYPTCFYRRLEPDNTLTVIRDRWFDPADVYGGEAGIAAATRLWWGAYAWLRDHDLKEVSDTSRLLRVPDDGVTARIADELEELAGAIDGSHRHAEPTSDVAMESGQVCYWLALRCLRDGLAWDDARPDRALGEAAVIPPEAVAALLRGEAETWRMAPVADVPARAHNSLALVAAACAVAGITPLAVIRKDLDELRSRPYLSDYFATAL